MIDLDAYDKMYVDGFFCRSDLNALVERLRQAEKDAERYRWLRENHWSESSLFVVADPEMVKTGAYCPSKDLLDAVIDEAMNGSNN